MELIFSIVEEFKKIDSVEAVVLSGSRTGLVFDEKSDFDLYIYSSTSVPIDFRTQLAKKFAVNFEVGNDFFGDGDEWIVENNVGIDLMYRDLAWAKAHVKSIWKDCNAWVGFTTAFVHNLKTAKILYDKNGDFANIQSELNKPYPQKLKENIVKKNYPLLKSKMTASFFEQIEKAIERNDLVSQNHRLTAFLNSYFDIIFAINEQTHPGEKKLVDWAEKTCKLLPNNFKENLESVIQNIGKKEVLTTLDKMIDELDKVLKI